MVQNLTSNNEESAILTALCRTDLTAWCFLPQLRGGVSYCSRAFLHLWKTGDGHNEKSFFGSISGEFIAGALAAQGIDSSQFFSFVADRGHDSSPPILLVRKDSQKIHAEVSLVTSGRRVIGHLVRFRELVEPNVIEAVLTEISRAQRRLDVLSPREREILSGICDGSTNKSISISADISEKTVEKHRSRIMQKLHVNSSAELFQLAARAMILSDRKTVPEIGLTR